MKLTIREDSTNYAASIVKLPPKQAVPGLDKLVRVTVFGNDILTQKDTAEDALYIFFPAECQINGEYLKQNNEFRELTKNADPTKKGFFEENGRVKAIKFKGIISTGYIAPISSLYPLIDYKSLKDGDEFTTIDGIDICKKYRPKTTQSLGGTKESRYNKKLKRFDRLVANQFRFHQDTSQLAKNLHLFNPEDIIVITDKWHGTSAVFANVLTNKKLTWFQRLASKLVVPSIKKYLSFKVYDNVYSSRSVVKNQYINKEQGGGYYGEDIWGLVNKELEGKIEEGITIYGEIVGYTQSGKAIQKGYDYGCDPSGDSSGLGSYQHKFLVYRITYTKPDGSPIEFSWQQVKNYCNRHKLETVKELYFGRIDDICYRSLGMNTTFTSDSSTVFMGRLQDLLLEKDCKHCTNKVPAEGICVRIDGMELYMTYKLKSKRFLKHETEEIDSGVISMEDDQVGEESTASDLSGIAFERKIDLEPSMGIRGL